jgi:hypothetical protein
VKKKLCCIMFLILIGLIQIPASWGKGKLPFQFGDRVKIDWMGKWRVATVIETEPGSCKIRFECDESLLDRWVPVDQLENFTYKVGNIVIAELNGKWIKARVLAASTTRYKVHFLGRESKFDDWLGPERIRDGEFAPGDIVLVSWKGHWYRAKIIAHRAGKYRVQLEGFANSPDEWFGTESLKSISF